MKISDIDKNLKVETKIAKDDIVFLDVRHEPFEVYGLYDHKKPDAFRRMPDEVAEKVSKGVKTLNRNTAGGRVRFSTDSKYVAIKCVLPDITRFPHMPLSGTSGFDLYLDSPYDSYHVKTFMPPVNMTDGYESICEFKTNEMRSFTINFPSYNSVTSLYIGLESTASVGEGKKYSNEKPIIYYGSSITQGGCASRSGLAYPNRIAQKYNLDFINLGFSGSARGEDAICEYMASLDMGIFVSDYDHNAPTPEHLLATHLKLYKTIREKHPDVPYIMISRPNPFSSDEASDERRNIINDTFRYAREHGDKRVYYIDGASFFRGDDEDSCTVDGCHPNDLGFSKMYSVISKYILDAIRDCGNI